MKVNELPCIAGKFSSSNVPHSLRAVTKIIWLRPDAIGDNVLASSMLPCIRQYFFEAHIIVVCQSHVAELYQTCAHVDEVIAFNRGRLLSNDIEYRNSLFKKLRELKISICFNSVFSSDQLTDVLASACAAKETIGFVGNLNNMPSDWHACRRPIYTKLLENGCEKLNELQRHQLFLKNLEIEAADLQAQVWISDEDSDFADKLFNQLGIDGARAIALFAGVRGEVRSSHCYGEALRTILKENDYSILALGAIEDFEINQMNLTRAGGRNSANLSGKCTIRQSAAILKRCKLAVGAETGLAHIACAVGTPNVILLGGGHFGRFMPYSPETSAVVNPLECFGCNWQCKYPTVHCIQDVQTRFTERSNSSNPQYPIAANRAPFLQQTVRIQVLQIRSRSRNSWTNAFCIEIELDQSKSLKMEAIVNIKNTIDSSSDNAVVPSGKKKPFVSICIITNSDMPGQEIRKSYLSRLIRSVTVAGFPKEHFEIIVTGAVDEIEGEVRKIDMRTAAAEGRVCALRNAAIAVARGDVIIHCDDDVIFTPGYWNALSEYFEKPWDILCTKLLNPNGSRYWDWAAFYRGKGQTLLPYDVQDTNVFATGGHSIYRKTVFEKVQWNESKRHGDNEEYEFAESARNTGGSTVASWEFMGGRVVETRLANGLTCSMLNNARTHSAVQPGSPGVPLPTWGGQSSDRLGYDGAGRLICKRYVSSTLSGGGYADPTAIVGFTTEYDLASNKLFERELHAETRSHLYEPFSASPANVPLGGYDSLNRLRQYQRGQLSSTTGLNDKGGGAVTTPISLPGTDSFRDYVLDGLGNWQRTNYTHVSGGAGFQRRQHNPLNEITRIDFGGSVSNYTYDANGNLLSDGSEHYTYDAFNRLVSVKRFNSMIPIGAYRYDAFNRRVQRTTSDSASNFTHSYIYSGWRCIEKRDDSDTVLKQFIWGIYLDELIQQKNLVALNNFAANATLYPLQDMLYRTTGLADDAGVVREAYDTDAYGNTIIYRKSGSPPSTITFADTDPVEPVPTCDFIFTGAAV